jgi:hypothetical protein
MMPNFSEWKRGATQIKSGIERFNRRFPDIRKIIGAAMALLSMPFSPSCGIEGSRLARERQKRTHGVYNNSRTPQKVISPNAAMSLCD